MFFRSERLFLRPIWPEDWQEFISLLNPERATRKLSHQCWPLGADDVQRMVSGPQNLRCLDFAITRLRSGAASELIGCIGLHGLDCGDIVLDYWIALSHRGHGYATEAARAILSLARAVGHRRLGAWQFLDDPASARVLAKLGFRPTSEIAGALGRARREIAPTRMHAIDLEPPEPRAPARSCAALS